ncbi:diguanylate cyclase/phosphodiesterase [Gracilibacillus boraciitolerans JCM 21714]|uniref:Diguanylate cyclase/phosphodiesterase n=1 Tax=Gracilibacillus boraciitolerans JCM 21714 TaxID=1298598 RepID=W4VPV3_9BACI|nr:diguanylate cyclase/phosphodiesterase [Gracilibacillus boraciitolerans JCM 21714]
MHNLCKQILSIINQPIIISNEKVMLEASIGISFYPDNGDTVDELLHHADTLMYQQKEIHHQQLDS